jgi:hypothetical protein
MMDLCSSPPADLQRHIYVCLLQLHQSSLNSLKRVHLLAKPVLLSLKYLQLPQIYTDLHHFNSEAGISIYAYLPDREDLCCL